MGHHSLRSDRRGVKWTLQAYLFLLILLTGVVVAAGSLPTDTDSRAFDDFQRQQVAEDLLEATDGTDSLDRAVRYWNASAGRWLGAAGGANDTTYTTLGTNRDYPLWPAVEEAFGQRTPAYNIAIQYQVDSDGDGEADGTETQRVVYQGPPGPDAITATRAVYLPDDATPVDGPTSADGDPCTVAELGSDTTTGTGPCRSGAFFAPEAAPASARYNLLEVELTVWNV